MLALRIGGHGPELGSVSNPLASPGFTLVRVVVAGICRTDLRVADGELGTPGGRVLGHELAGFDEKGLRVTVFPGIACGNCLRCQEGMPPWRCVSLAMLGVDVDGAFAEWVRVPESCVVPLPESLSWKQGAFVEPVAAALGVIEVDRRLDARIIVHGSGRIAELMVRLLQFCGRKNVTWILSGERVLPNRFDLAIETTGKSEDIALLMGGLVPGGRLVLKSRVLESIELNPVVIVRKSLQIVGAHYGDFYDAVAILERGLPVADLLAEPVALADWERAFAAARQEGKKQFLQIDADPSV